MNIDVPLNKETRSKLQSVEGKLGIFSYNNNRLYYKTRLILIKNE